METDIANAAHHIALGQQDRQLFDPADEALPWDLVISCEPAGQSLVCDAAGQFITVPASVQFTAPHSSGLVFHWTVDVGERDNAAFVNLDTIKHTLDHVHGPGRLQFIELVQQRVQFANKAALDGVREGSALLDRCKAAYALIESP